MAYTLDAAPPDDGKTIEGMAGQNPAIADPALLPVSKLGVGQQFDAIKGWFLADADHSREWRGQAAFCFAFRAGDQWSPEDKALLESQSRPVIVFNRVLTILKAVAGMEINGRHEIAFLPRGTEDTAPNEVLCAASKWMADSCDGEDEESQAFDQTCTTGMGWVEERMSYEDEPEGLYLEEMVDCREMYWDRTAKKKNLADARRMHRARRMPLGDALALFPNATRETIDATWAEGLLGDYPEKSLEDKRKRDTDNVSTNPYDDLYEVTIVHSQWIEREVYWIVADLQEGTKAELTDQQHGVFEQRMKALGMPVHSVRMVRKVYKHAFLGAIGTMLQPAGDAPIKGQFSWKCITGELDAVKGTWFGLVKILRDPQMWANKWLSQILHILNSTAKGGVIAERGAFDDEREAEEGYAQPEAITWAADGALSGPNPKIIPKPGQATMTDGYLGLLTFAISSFKDVSGINLELLGQQDANQPGILEAMRKQAGMTVLATLFDSLRRFRKQVGRTRLYFVQNFLSDGRLIRVAGPDQVKAVPLAKDKTFGRYDVVVDDTPTSPNQKEANWAIIQPMLAVFRDQLMANPQVLAMILEYSPLPSRIVDAVKQFVAQAAQDPEQKMTKQIAIAGAIATIEKDKSIANLNNAKAGGAQSTAIYEISMAQNLLADNKHQELKHHLELMRAGQEARQAELDAGLAAGQHMNDTAKVGLDAAKTHIAAKDADTRRITAVANARKTMADVHTGAAGAAHDRMGMLIDHLSNLHKPTRDLAAAAQHHAAARQIDRTPVSQPGAA